MNRLLPWIMTAAVVVSMVTASMNETDIENFMKKYGYMLEDCDTDESKNMNHTQKMRWGILLYQGNMGIPQTGEADDETIAWMEKPRCGLTDRSCRRGPDKSGRQRFKRFAVGSPGWEFDPITYKFINYSPDLPLADIERILGDALKLWSDAADVNFREVSASESAIIEISFVTGDHGDGNPFDGPGGTLAHAYFPLPTTNPIGGDAHFDDAESYTDGEDSGINLLFVGVHEFGHSLGLGHSDVQDAIMFPTYLGYRPGLQLNQDDVDGIRAIYGARVNTDPPGSPDMPTADPSGPEPPRDDFCTQGRVDAIAVLRGMTFAFQDTYYALIHPTRGIEDGYPRNVTDWSGLESANVDAILDSRDGSYVYILQGASVYRYSLGDDGLFVLAEGYPQALSDKFPGAPADMDMALRWGRNGRGYFFKDNDFYLLSPSDMVRRDNPRPIEAWNLPAQDYTASFRAEDGNTYFFYDDQTLQYSDTDLSVAEGYPQSTRDRWFVCDRTTTVPPPGTTEAASHGTTVVTPSLIGLLISFVTITHTYLR